MNNDVVNDIIHGNYVVNAKYGLSALLIACFMIFSSETNAQDLEKTVIDRIHFRAIGPTKQGSRIVDFGVPNQNKQPYTFYVGVCAGGVWKTTDNGITYKPIFDDEATSSIGDIAVAPSDPNIVWVGTGRFTFAGDGVYKSIDAGKTWQNMGLEGTQRIIRVAIHPVNPDIVYVAAVGPFYSESPDRGLYKTTNGGRAWEKVLGVTKDGQQVGFADVVIDHDNPETIYAASWDRPLGDVSAFRSAGIAVSDGRASGIHKSTDGGKTWKELTNGLPDVGYDKISLDIYLKNTDILYALINIVDESGDRNKRLVFRTDNGGELWRQTHEEDSRINGGSYFHAVRVNPNDPNHLFLLSTASHYSDDGGKTWHRAFKYGGDNCELWINPDNSNNMLLGYDYGLAVSFSGGETWYHPDDLPLAQFYAIGVDMDYPYNVYGGTQDFGTWKGPSTKKGRFPIRFEDWEHILGGDGFYSQADPTDSRWLYVESQYGGISRNDQKTGTRSRIQYRGDDARYNWNAPIHISPHNSNVIYHGAQWLLRSSYKGENLEKISTDLSKNDPSFRRHRRERNSITTIDESPVQQGILWIGTDDGNVQLSKDNGETWTLLNDRIPDHPDIWVSRVTASRHYAGTAYVSFTGEKRDDFTPYVYKTDDFGQTWTSIVNNLPQEPVNDIKEDHRNHNLLFLGSNLGLYVSLNGGSSWIEMKNNLPTVPVRDLVIHPRENDLVVGTFGRGIYIADISPLQELTEEVISKDVHFFDIEPKVQWIIPSQPSVSAQNFDGENESHGAVINYYLKDDVPDGVTITVYDGPNQINELLGTGNAGLNSVEWGMTKRGRKRTTDEIAEYDEQVATGEREPYYDYYDTVDFYGDPDEEVGKTGLSLRTRVAWEPGMRGRDYVLHRVLPGKYTIKLMVGGNILEKSAQILQDHWYDKSY